MFEALLNHCCPGAIREYKFHPTRRWRFDYAWPDTMVAFEKEGGTWNLSRHTTGRGYAADCEKYSEAAILGWAVIRATTDMINNGMAIQMVERAIRNNERKNKELASDAL